MPVMFRVLSAAVGLAVAPLAGAQSWPAKPVRLIVNFAAGGSTDVIARSMATKLTETLGQQVVVDNRVGVGGNIGLEAVAKSAPDGYTLLHSADGTILINPHLYKMARRCERKISTRSRPRPRRRYSSSCARACR